MTEPIRILIADDHPVVRGGLEGMLAGEADFEVIAEAATGVQAVDLALRLRPNVVLMDLRMPELSGVKAISQIKLRWSDANILVLTTYDSDADILAAVEAGATGYLLKDTPREDLFRAIRAAALGQSVLAPKVAARLMGRMQTPSPETLSAREVEVLTLVARGSNNRAIGNQLHISEATVKYHLIHIFGKLGVDDRTAAVTEALDQGMLRLDHSSENRN